MRHLQIYRDKTDAPLAPPPSPLNAVRSVGAGEGGGGPNQLFGASKMGENQRFSGAGGTGGNLRRNSGGVLASIK